MIFPWMIDGSARFSPIFRGSTIGTPIEERYQYSTHADAEIAMEGYLSSWAILFAGAST